LISGSITDVQYATRQAGLLQDRSQREHGQRRLLRRFHHHRAAGGDGGPDLAGTHRQRKIPRRDQHARPDRLLHDEQAPGAVRRDAVAPLDAHGLLGEPAEELGAVGDLGLRLLQRLAHLERHEKSEVVLALDDQLPRAPQDLAAVARRRVLPLGLLLVRGSERGDGVVGRRVGDLGYGLLGRGILDREHLSLGPVAPLPADVELVRHAVHDGLFPALRISAHVATVSCPSSSEMATSIE
jgi:hypothetical protein